MATAKFEWLCIDMEHTAIDLKEAEILISTIPQWNKSISESK